MHWVWIVPLALLIVYLFSPRFRGDIAETRVRRLLANGLEKSRHTILDDVVIPSGGGTIRIDHVVVSKFGLFVIESQYAPGWVSGGEFQEQWKRSQFNRSRRFENPAHRVAMQAHALERLLQVPATKIIPIVAMVGTQGFKTPMPDHVVQAEKLIPLLRKKTHQRLDEDQARRLLKAIEEVRIDPGRGGQVSHWTMIRAGLILLLLAGLYLALEEDIEKFRTGLAEQSEKKESPELFREDGSRKSEQELWEDSLQCAWSSDTGRCSCYDPGGERVEIERDKCRELAERGSILKQ